MSTTSMRNKALVRRYIEEVVNGGDARLLAELVGVDHVVHGLDGDLYGLEGARIELADWRTGFPDLHIVVQDLIAEGDRVVCRYLLRGTQTGRFLGIPATGRAVEVAGVAIDRLTDGQLVERWMHLDLLCLLHQLGVAGCGVPGRWTPTAQPESSGPLT